MTEWHHWLTWNLFSILSPQWSNSGMGEGTRKIWRHGEQRLIKYLKSFFSIFYFISNLSPLPPPSPSHPSGSAQCTSPEHPVSCIEPGLVIHFIYDNIHVSMPSSQIIPPSPSPTESRRLFYTSVSLFLSCIQGYRYHLSKFHIYMH